MFCSSFHQPSQLIGTLPLFVNPASLAGGAATPTLPLQGLQVQTVTPQLLLNTQGQIIAAVGNGPAAVVTSAAALPKTSTAPTPNKASTQVGGRHLSERRLGKLELSPKVFLVRCLSFEGILSETCVSLRLR